MLYSELQCSEAIHKAVERMGFAEMTEIQEKTIPVMLVGRDVIAKAPTGTGKTSIVNLLGRYYECREGRVMIDGIDVKDMPLKSLRDRIGYVMQETFLFSAHDDNAKVPLG